MLIFNLFFLIWDAAFAYVDYSKGDFKLFGIMCFLFGGTFAFSIINIARKKL